VVSGREEQCAGGLAYNAAHLGVGQAIGHGVARELLPIEATGATERTEPEVALRVLHHGAHLALGKPILGGKLLEAMLLRQ